MGFWNHSDRMKLQISRHSLDMLMGMGFHEEPGREGGFGAAGTIHSLFSFNVHSFVAFKIAMSRDPTQGELCAWVSFLCCFEAVEECIDKIVGRVWLVIADSQEAHCVVSSTGCRVKAEESEEE